MEVALPWCEECSKFWNPPSVGVNGECPTCGSVIVKERPRAPWHFKVLLLGLAGYMVYRVYWLIEWLPKHI
ncbi:MAG TPA: hypothetical protein VG184_10045 [Acidimicrobiales bacterium]|nr:hypothetical protein [Acidimicrobiales bacterium]